MKIQAVFLDIDGTFYDDRQARVLPQTLHALQCLQAKGYKLALCSGRSLDMAKRLGVMELLSWDGYIGSGGVSIYDEKLQLLHEQLFAPAIAAQIFAIAKQHHICVHAHGASNFMSEELNSYGERVLKRIHCPIPVVRPWQQDPISALSIYGEDDETWPMFAHLEGVRPLLSSPNCFDFMNDTISKATGIHTLMQYWQLDPQAYMAFGDSMNDVDMIKAAAIGVVMGNGDERLKPYADIIIGNSDTPAIAAFLKEQGML